MHGCKSHASFVRSFTKPGACPTTENASASVIRVADFDEALAVANDTPFGLSSGICTSSLKHATAFRRGSKAGMVMVNLPTAGVDYHVPFDGCGASSLGGREQGRIAMDFYTSVTTAYIFAG
ncbi:aldehyde dehydrogenase family protein [Paracoccus fistulariae]|uniref:Aldehyde dehydrogenase family protein n=1 Tax=Paracoccus fistulariae TaxID=658446 RepID=A0ABY7SMT8_9RHOB|nr:aldehyde dehydrogenase family protein [Paracoccus fistulariae]